MKVLKELQIEIAFSKYFITEIKQSLINYLIN